MRKLRLETNFSICERGTSATSAALDYFRECYDKRVMLVHPKNRVSAEVVPTLWADDFYDNYEVLADLYRRLLLSEA